MSITGYTELDATNQYSYLTILTSLSQSIVSYDFLNLPKETRHQLLDKLAETSEYLYKKYQNHFEAKY